MSDTLAKWSKLRTQVLPRCRQCPPALMDQEIRTSAIRFCTDTHVWTYDHDPLAKIVDVISYELDAPGCAEIDTILEIWQKGGDGFTLADPDRTGTLLKPNVDYLFNEDKRTLELLSVPAATVENAWRITLALRPTEEATEMDERVLDDYREWISHGAIWNLKEMEGANWYNPQTAIYHKNQYYKGVARAINNRATGRLQRSVSMASRGWL